MLYIRRNLLILGILCFLIAPACLAEESSLFQASPNVVVLGKKLSKKTLRIEPRDSSTYDLVQSLQFCLVFGSNCHELKVQKSRYNKKSSYEYTGQSQGSPAIEVTLPRWIQNDIRSSLSGIAQGEYEMFTILAKSPDNQIIDEISLAIYPPTSAKIFRVKKKKKGKKFKGKQSRIRRVLFTDTSPRPSFTYSGPGIGAQVCQGGSVYNSYAAYLDCADDAIVDCRAAHSDEYDIGYCIYDRCGNVPDEIETLWRTVDEVQDSKSGTQSQVWKDGDGVAWGSSSFSSHQFEVQLHPCFYDGAANLSGTIGATATIMDYDYQLIQGVYTIFHPARSENVDLSRSRVTMGFNFKTLVRVERNNFGQTTVPLSYAWEIFKSIERKKDGIQYEGDDSTHFLNGVIPLYAYFRPQGVLGFEIDAQVLPISRVLDFQYSAYGDFGTGYAAGPARNGVSDVSYDGYLSLFQTESYQRRYIALEATDDGILPSLSDVNEIEFWPIRGTLTACASWFKGTSHPNHSEEQCGEVAAPGAITTRQGSIRVVSNGDPKILQYYDPSDEEEKPLPGDYAPFPYRDPIMEDF